MIWMTSAKKSFIIIVPKMADRNSFVVSTDLSGRQTMGEMQSSKVNPILVQIVQITERLATIGLNLQYSIVRFHKYHPTADHLHHYQRDFRFRPQFPQCLIV